ncbi:MAG TPA: L,D-transpeptidase family protein, partial [Flavisolibacter sp.]|nr:L,D-transpeptidase family protein [Flavisolibacter sp.]
NISKDSSFFNKKLHRQLQALLNNDNPNRNDYNSTQLELELTDHFFDYAQYAYAGRVDPEKLQWYIPRRKINATALLDSLIQRNGNKLDEWEPVNEQYRMVRKQLVRLYDIQKKGGWPLIEAGKKALWQGDSSLVIGPLKERLFLAGDFHSDDRSNVFTPELETAVQQAQHRFGLTPDGVVGPRTLNELNKPVEKRIEQLLVNMERMRWMPAQGKGLRLVVNIPEFRLHVYNGKNEQFQMRIVVGRAANKTVVFSDELKYIVFSPYWNVPASIVRNEILPAMRRNEGYLARHNMEQTGTHGGLPVIRQKPGSNNALGRVKFLFPNSFNIYFHDTPAKLLFKQQQRAFSHGCIRLAEPMNLASFLLKDNRSWTDKRISKAMYAGRETWVTLEKPVPVEITYFTAWIDRDGLLNFREDIYGHDEELAGRLFQN